MGKPEAMGKWSRNLGIGGEAGKLSGEKGTSAGVSGKCGLKQSGPEEYETIWVCRLWEAPIQKEENKKRGPLRKTLVCPWASPWRSFGNPSR